MHTLILAAACTGNWQQQWNCGSHGGGSNVGAAAASAGSTFPPVAIGVVILLILFTLFRKGRSGKTATSN